jgi:hypothetical protein
MAAAAAAVPPHRRWIICRLCIWRISRPCAGDQQSPLRHVRYLFCLAQNCDMNEEMRQDCVDLVITACERYAGNFEVRADGTAGTGSRCEHCKGGLAVRHR